MLRDTVGRLLFGAYKNELYANELRIRDLDKEFSDVSSELSGISKLLGHAGQAPTIAWLEAERALAEAERAKVERDIAASERGIYEATDDERISLKAQEGAYQEVQKLQVDINTRSASLESIAFEIEDANVFIRDLEFKLQHYRIRLQRRIFLVSQRSNTVRRATLQLKRNSEVDPGNWTGS